MKWVDYREKLGLGFSDTDKFVMLKNSLVNLLDYLEDNCNFIYRDEHSMEYFIMIGEKPLLQNRSALFNVGRSICNCINTAELISKYIAFYNSYLAFNSTEVQRNVNTVLSFLTERLDDYKIPYSLYTDSDGCFIFPKGAEELDAALVSEPLEWLQAYPEAQKTYIIALKQYSDGEYIRDVADNLRKALEAFLQEFLSNCNNLETNKNEICKYLGSQNVDAGIGGLFQPLINAYKNINDRIAKHNDKVDKKLLEFLLYQTGVLIRMVLSVKNAETEEADNAD